MELDQPHFQIFLSANTAKIINKARIFAQDIIQYLVFRR